MLSPTVQVLIPTRSDVLGVSRVLGESLGQDPRVHALISVSDPKSQKQMEEMITSLGDERIKVLPSCGDLTLYGNFRRLVENSTGEYLSICADDDSMKYDTIKRCLEQMSVGCMLVIPPIEVRDFNRTHHRFSDLIVTVPARVTSRIKILQAARVAPTWVFGLWRGSFLRDAFPPDDFDWLDCALVQRVILNDELCFAPNAESMICGLVQGRPPWSVDTTSGHSIAGWRQYSYMHSLKDGLFQRLAWKLLVERRWRRIARRLNT